jgi:hypothetical protein
VSDEVWKPCSVCKKPIALGALYWTCNVSTCNRKRTALRFCTVSCWDAHLPFANHRDAWAEEQTAPTTPEPPGDAAGAPTSQPRRRIVPKTSAPEPSGATSREVLVIASRLKEYVRAKSGFKTSDRVLGPLSDIIRGIADEAITNARREGRMTLLDRDVPER